MTDFANKKDWEEGPATPASRFLHEVLEPVFGIDSEEAHEQVRRSGDITKDPVGIGGHEVGIIMRTFDDVQARNLEEKDFVKLARLTMVEVGPMFRSLGVADSILQSLSVRIEEIAKTQKESKESSFEVAKRTVN